MANTLVVQLVLVFVITLDIASPSHISVDSTGSYKDVTVSVSSTAQHELSKDFQSLERFLIAAAERIFHATRNHSRIHSIFILLPSSWPADPNVKEATFQSYSEADIRIDLSNPYTNEYNDGEPLAYVHQPRGCGQRGDFINIPMKTLQKWKWKRDYAVTHFAQKWARLNYGVFEEFGYKNDQLFPLNYRDPGTGHFKVTGCSNPYAWKSYCRDKINQLDCSNFELVPRRVLSSIMDTANLKAETFCDSTINPHDVAAPTRQNALCQEKSTWDVILQNEGFPKTPQHTAFVAPMIEVVKVLPTNVVIIIDPVLCKNFSTTISHPLQMALSKLLTDLEFATTSIIIANVQMNVINSTQVECKSSTLCMMQMVENLCTQPMATTSNLIEAINRAITVLRSTNGPGHIIQMIHEPNLISNNILQIIFDIVVAEFKIFLITWTHASRFISYPSRPHKDEVIKYRNRFHWSDITYPTSIDQCYAESLSRNNEVFEKFSDGFERESFYPKRIKVFESISARGTFAIDKEENTFIFGCYICKRYNIAHEFELRIDGQTFKTKQRSNDSSFFHELQLRRKQGTIMYNWVVRGLEANYRPWIVSSVWIVSKDGNIQDGSRMLTGDVSVNFKQSPGTVIIYAYTSRKRNVTAEITSSKREVFTFPLWDNGNGDPDVKLDDGIYSRYFVNLENQPNFYSVKLKTNEQTIDLGLILFPRGNISSYPPNRVVDFHASSIDVKSQEVTFQWTASGGAYDHGHSSFYALKCDTSRKEVSEAKSFLPQMILSAIYPKEAGERETYKWKVPSRHVMYHCVLWSVAVDVDHNKKRKSNVIAVYIPSLRTETESTLSTITDIVTNVITEANRTVVEEEEKYGQNCDCSYDVKIAITVVSHIVFIILAVVITWNFAQRQFKKQTGQNTAGHQSVVSSPFAGQPINSNTSINQSITPAETPNEVIGAANGNCVRSPATVINSYLHSRAESVSVVDKDPPRGQAPSMVHFHIGADEVKINPRLSKLLPPKVPMRNQSLHSKV